jgi:uncharacterized protein YoxC
MASNVVGTKEDLVKVRDAKKNTMDQLIQEKTGLLSRHADELAGINTSIDNLQEEVKDLDSKIKNAK